MATFYKGQHYRIAICSDESLGKMQFSKSKAEISFYQEKNSRLQKRSEFN